VRKTKSTDKWNNKVGSHLALKSGKGTKAHGLGALGAAEAGLVEDLAVSLKLLHQEDLEKKKVSVKQGTENTQHTHTHTHNTHRHTHTDTAHTHLLVADMADVGASGRSGGWGRGSGGARGSAAGCDIGGYTLAGACREVGAPATKGQTPWSVCANTQTNKQTHKQTNKQASAQRRLTLRRRQ
jgi:hypothetical protein